MKQVWVIALLGFALLLAGCGSKAQVAPPRLQQQDPASVQKTYVHEEGDVAAVTTVPVYPGANVETKEKESSANISPDETRYHVVLSTSDPLDKVQPFYEKAVGGSAQKTPQGLSIIARTERGNDVMMTMSNDGKKTTVDFKVIVYKH